MQKNYRAVWGKPLVIISIVATVVCGVVAAMQKDHAWWRWALPALLPVCCAPFAILGYTLDGRSIGVRRPFWTTRIPMGDGASAEILPCAMKGSIRSCGNGGIYSFTGWYFNRALGSYRAFVTDQENTVVVRTGRKTLVLSPSPAEDFVEAVNRGDAAG